MEDEGEEKTKGEEEDDEKIDALVFPMGDEWSDDDDNETTEAALEEE